MLSNQGVELLARLRTALGLTGNSRIEVSDIASPVVVVQSLDGAPYRDDVVQFIAFASISPGVGNLGAIRLFCPAAMGLDRAVVDRVVITDTSGATQTYRVRMAYDGSQLANANALINCFSPELASVNPATPGRVSLQFRTEFGAAFPGGGFEDVCQVIAPANTTQVIDLDIALRPGVDVLINNQTANQAVAATFFGRYFFLRGA